MLTLLAYANYARSEHRSVGKYLLVVLVFALGLMCKPTLVTVPFVLLLLDYWPLGRMRTAKGKRETSLARVFQNLRISAFQLFAVLRREDSPLHFFRRSCLITILVQQRIHELQAFRFSAIRKRGSLLRLYLAQSVWPAETRRPLSLSSSADQPHGHGFSGSCLTLDNFDRSFSSAKTIVHF